MENQSEFNKELAQAFKDLAGKYSPNGEDLGLLIIAVQRIPNQEELEATILVHGEESLIASGIDESMGQESLKSAYRKAQISHLQSYISSKLDTIRKTQQN